MSQAYRHHEHEHARKFMQLRLEFIIFVLEVVPRQLRVGPFLTDVYS
jgi:hypothetical protein